MLIQHCLTPDNTQADRCSKRDVRVENGKIAEVAELLAPCPNEETFDARGKLLLPGMVNAHYHSYSNLWKGTAWGEPLEVWSSDTIGLGGLMGNEEAVLSAYLGIAEMLHAGVTACIDHIPHANRVDAISGAYRQTGFRAAVAPMISDIGDDRALCGMRPSADRTPSSVQNMADRYDDWVGRWHDPDGTLQMLCALNAPQRASEQALAVAADIRDKYRLGVHTHLLETRWQAASAVRAGRDPVRLLEAFGLLTDRTGLAHCVYLNEDQVRRIADAGSTVIHIPTGNLFLGSGRADIAAYREHGIAAAIGSDGSNCATGQNLLTVLRSAVLLQRMTEPDARKWMRVRDAWNMATVNGARAAGFNSGAVKPGMCADLVLADLSALAYQPCYDPLLQSILLADRLDVTDVWIGGKAVMRDRKLLCMDEDALKEEIRKRTPELRASVRRTKETVLPEKKRFETAYYEQIAGKGEEHERD